MPKNDNAHALRLLAALRSTGHNEVASSYERDYPLSNSADVMKKYRWACDVCHALEAQFSPDEALSIRQACRCGDGKSMAKEISGCISKAGDLPGGCKLFSEKNKYAFLKYVSDHELIFGYHACVCSCIKRAEGDVPALWGECSVGYVSSMFKQIYGDSVSVQLLGSAKSGADRCTFRIRW